MINHLFYNSISLFIYLQHNTKEDCWIIIDNNVYDITKYIDSHPGGIDILLGYAGKDDDHGFVASGHSNEAKSKLETLIIGFIPNKVSKMCNM